MGGGYEGGALSVLLELFIVETPERAPAPSTTWGPQRGRVTVSEEERSHLTPNPWAPRSWTPQSPNLPERNVCCLRAPQHVMFCYRGRHQPLLWMSFVFRSSL